MRLREQRYVERPTAMRHVIERDLVREQRLSGTRLAGDEIDATDEQTATEDVVEARYAGGYLFEGRRSVIGRCFRHLCKAL